jgi:hypothetical protein
MAILPLPPDGPLAQVTTITICDLSLTQSSGFRIQQRGIREADGSVTGIGLPYLHLRSDHLADVAYDLSV